MTKYEITHDEPRNRVGINPDSVKSFDVNGKKYKRHKDFFYDPDIPLETLNTTTYVLGVKIRYYKPWHKKLIPSKGFFIVSFLLLVLLVFLR